MKTRTKTIWRIESLASKGVFSSCSCGGEVLYYSDKGVRCSTCGKLYAIWTNNRQSQIKRSIQILEGNETKPSSDELTDLELKPITETSEGYSKKELTQKILVK
jgi:hypothetical protein